ncbi:hypothetical protein KFK09_014752 [Dendrobium nobile]|uniref:Uncharacterized protein n=1 Tax=Dendrobium nobile TaxID=94219 RepID=A0A8T3B4T9_DENNO|nr:hypothetical protein KFK09_014752 [Dendrobium nobile]
MFLHPQQGSLIWIVWVNYSRSTLLALEWRLDWSIFICNGDLFMRLLFFID